MIRGLLDGLTAIPAIMAEQNCSWEEAHGLWKISMEMEAEAEAAKAGPPSAVIIPFPIDRVRQ
jgi:hypothetical protein